MRKQEKRAKVAAGLSTVAAVSGSLASLGGATGVALGLAVAGVALAATIGGLWIKSSRERESYE